MASDPVATDLNASTRAPLHLWIVGIAALLWNAIGVIDYVMTRMHNDAYLGAVMPGLEPAAIYTYIDAMPIAAQAGWGFGVWGAMVGTLLLLARSRHAVVAYLVSLIGALVSFGIQFAGPKPPAGMDDGIMPIVIIAIAFGLLIYARAMQARGVLR